MTTARILNKIAYAGFDATVEPQMYVDAVSPRMSISVRAAAGAGDIETRFIVWGMFQASQHIVTNQVCRNITFALQLDNIDVGYIEFSKQEVPLGTIPSRSNAQNQPPDSDAWSSTQSAGFQSQRPGNLTLLSTSDGPAAFDITLIRTRVLTKYIVFANIFTGLAYIAQFPSLQRVGTFSLSLPPPFQAITGFDPSPSPQAFQYCHAAAALTYVGGYMLGKNEFFEVGVRISVEGSEVGNGYIITRW